MFFKKKHECEHEFILADRYFNHVLTEFLNGSDSIELFAVRTCKKCLQIQETSIDKKYYPVNNGASRDLKNHYLKLLADEHVKSKEEYLLGLLEVGK